MKYLLLVLCGFVGLSVQAQVADVDITKLSEKDLAGKFLVDVRTPDEYGEGHFAGALNLDSSEPDFLSQWKGIDKSTPVYVYCRTGKRSARVTKSLDSLGFKEVYNLQGGYQAWEKEQAKKEKHKN
ncbi:Rhodanese-related sulfurtransferase [Sinomicrobium oceani]|uniref:Rhodanese-related sulfurtransferase n=1 Tax=Sinomicrobium oceani TaxID=1150368 RepID=A0A1K1RJB1_9FLAO|nr:rhodanese-like domain-containing protein [Sinomicrobium oceani]SFW72117.1 Rhodanese-related sulfurtransferase [Sinomicrobium oceani]